MSLHFISIRWRNFLSTGNVFTEIKLDKSPNTLIIGKNGAGKSTFLDALCFVLFGKPFRKIKKPGLINTINTKDSLVEVQFTVSNKLYKVVRSIKPNVFEIYCDGILVNQDAASRDYQEYLEKNILKMNFKSFTQIIILGSASFTPFMQLSASDRRAIIEDLLDIQIFSSMNTVLKQRMIDTREQCVEVKNNIKVLQVSIAATENLIRELQADKQSKIEANLAEITTKMEQIHLLQLTIDALNKDATALRDTLGNQEQLKAKINKLMSLESQIESNKKKSSKEISFFKDNDVCPTCQQDIEEHFKQEHLSKCTDKFDQYSKALVQIEEQITSLSHDMKEIEEKLEKISSLNTDVAIHNTRIEEHNKFIVRLNKENEKLLANNAMATSEHDNKEELTRQIEEYRELEKNLSETQHYYEVAGLLLKDTGIKTKIIKQYLPVMNKLINKYLTTMDFFVNFNLDENFNETIKSRYRDEFEYANFSEGEKKKIDLALLFTWRAVARMKNSISTNLLVLDEVFDSSLDSSATEELLKILNALGEDTNVFVISHKDDILFDKFRSVIRFEKVNNFSRIAK